MEDILLEAGTIDSTFRGYTNLRKTDTHLYVQRLRRGAYRFECRYPKCFRERTADGEGRLHP